MFTTEPAAATSRRSILTKIAASAVGVAVAATTFLAPVGAESPAHWTSEVALTIDAGAGASRTVGAVPERQVIEAVGGLTVRPTGPTPPGPVGPTDWANPTVPGAPLDHGPELGRPLTIIGIGTGDVLDFRLAPSPTADIVASYPLTLTEFDMFALGEAWAAPSGVWWKVNVMGTVGWANQQHLGIRAGSAPIFDEVAEELQILMFGSIDELALDVAATRATAEPASRIVVITEPVVQPLGDGGGMGTVFVDVLDLGDLQAFIAAFTTGDLAADIAAPFGVLDLADVQAFIAAFTAGCP